MSEDWDRLARAFEAARVLGAADRAAFIAALSDAAFRSELETLLRNDKPDDFLNCGSSISISTLFRELPIPPRPGEVLKNRYRLEERMATGGQALVYRATDNLLSRPVVVKLLRMERRENGWLQTRLQEEMRLLARIDHPSVVGILDTGELADGSLFLVIQYVDGESLRDALRSGPLERKRAAGIVRQIGSALSAVHALGIAHRDLKPENIMLQRLADGTETAKLIDFGIAKVDRSDHSPETITIAIAGTVRYMAPEQFEGKNGPTSDLYSLALIVCELLSGQPDIRALSSKDRRVHRTIERALAFLPANRPPNVRAWSEELANELSCSTRRIFVKETGMAVGVLGGAAVAAGVWFDGQRDFSRVVEHSGAFDPLGEGFKSTMSWLEPSPIIPNALAMMAGRSRRPAKVIITIGLRGRRSGPQSNEGGS